MADEIGHVLEGVAADWQEYGERIPGVGAHTDGV
jgi:hypothetical protein